MYLTVVETPYYLKKVSKLFSAAQREEIVTTVACNPEIGDLMKGTGGVRKFRFAFQQSKGKSGGARIVHLPVTSKGKIFLLDAFGKNEKENLSQAERNEMAKVARALKGETP